MTDSAVSSIVSEAVKPERHKYLFSGRRRTLSNGEDWFEKIECKKGSEWGATIGDEVECKPSLGISEDVICMGALKRQYGSGYVLIMKKSGVPRAIKASNVVSVRQKTAVDTKALSQSEVDKKVDEYAAAEKVSLLAFQLACSPVVRRVVSLTVVARREPCRVLRRKPRLCDQKVR
jgi:hypothetical protein